jgi:hypothetical protein
MLSPIWGLDQVPRIPGRLFSYRRNQVCQNAQEKTPDGISACALRSSNPRGHSSRRSSAHEAIRRSAPAPESCTRAAIASGTPARSHGSGATADDSREGSLPSAAGKATHMSTGWPSGRRRRAEGSWAGGPAHFAPPLTRPLRPVAAGPSTGNGSATLPAALPHARSARVVGIGTSRNPPECAATRLD